ncbi:MAG TPA: hypothetical protein VEY10_08555 [Flavisolibacter sp.]|jgi:hypothetical protein|nr:hypothetical protein [Flavisolibacter sp.]
MKNLLFTASALGAGIAGLILYYQRKNKPANRITGAAKDAYQMMNSSADKLERPAHHTMG